MGANLMKMLMKFLTLMTVMVWLSGCSSSGSSSDGDSGDPETPANQQASGLSISGTMTVGETLSASGVSDGNGTDNATLMYKWMANGSDISGATSSTYVLQSTDAGKTISVTVTFTDDDGYDESLTATASGTVAVATSGTQGNGMVSIPAETVFLKGTAMDAATFVITDADGVGSKTAYTWKSGSSTVSDVATYTPVSSSDLSVSIDYTDQGSNNETVTVNLAQKKVESKDQTNTDSSWQSVAMNYYSGFYTFVNSQSAATYDTSASLASFALARYKALKVALDVINDDVSCSSGSKSTNATVTTFSDCVTTSGTLDGSLTLALSTTDIEVEWTSSGLTLAESSTVSYKLSGQETTSWSGSQLMITAGQDIVKLDMTASETTETITKEDSVSTFSKSDDSWSFSQDKTDYTWIHSQTVSEFVKKDVSFETALSGQVSGGVFQPAEQGKWMIEWNSQQMITEVTTLDELTATVDLDEDGNATDESFDFEWSL